MVNSFTTQAPSLSGSFQMKWLSYVAPTGFRISQIIHIDSIILFYIYNNFSKYTYCYRHHDIYGHVLNIKCFSLHDGIFQKQATHTRCKRW